MARPSRRRSRRSTRTRTCRDRSRTPSTARTSTGATRRSSRSSPRSASASTSSPRTSASSTRPRGPPGRTRWTSMALPSASTSPSWSPARLLPVLRCVRRPLTADVPTDSSVEAPPSLQPAKKYCDVTGLEVCILAAELLCHSRACAAQAASLHADVHLRRRRTSTLARLSAITTQRSTRSSRLSSPPSSRHTSRSAEGASCASSTSPVRD